MRNDPYSRYSALKNLCHDLFGFSQDCPGARNAEPLSVKLFTYAQSHGHNVTDRAVLESLGKIKPTVRRILEIQRFDIYSDSQSALAERFVDEYKAIAAQVDELTPRFEHMVQFKLQLSEALSELRQLTPLQTTGDSLFIAARAANIFAELVEYSSWIQLQLRLHEDEEHKLIQLIEAFLKQCDATKFPERIASAEQQLDRLRVLYLLEEVNR